ncbi:DUF992 domain-containing protein [Agrobacterium rhizogenes]|uniref:DUF992 domain-containing protein n=1 Tax=Rhizobium rhizogenes NBRC 13257 TaxID=1220581 RepID=A0AA87Q0P3_RHIRH|nr:DUF992 domain-containing protein [Rhizobium rhizogenes]KAA6488461.1 DUF992 domain-containing protein [Agrobacterium sp. ICMP 7243]OCJ01931.1 hypothetical protein A6U85_09800 [Agrobacterium sp. 13-626]OCJ15382.1 hypothetical protein A6U89_19205 [Agrobacterium sp. B133/95]KEA09009.1 hypothetical protein CN09_25415 [Rhizobium rhizogenes]MQB30921.1 DUF992 domain-containing protein [Rhizobium rhizogenes]
MKNFALIVAAASLALGVPIADAQTMHRSHKQAHKEQAAAGPKERLGTLSCQIAGGVGMVIGSNKSVDCLFKRRSGPAERYVGSIGKLGLDIGITGKSYLSWVVYSTQATRAGEGALAGSYVGASAGASVGLGLGANALVGGSSKNFGLQPLSGEAGTGLNVAAGVSRLQLRTATR